MTGLDAPLAGFRAGAGTGGHPAGVRAGRWLSGPSIVG